jgi:1,4-dihydroxy-6-naphthoate synthase
MKLTLGFSPCPNDTFIFDALVSGAIKSEELEFEVVLEDVQTLNAWAARGKLDVTKLSFPALFDNADEYAILQSGSALGKGVGPLLIARNGTPVHDMEACSIAIPGENTTAAFLLSYAFPHALHTRPVLFSSIEDAVLRGETDLGVIIHENRFTYQEKGLVKVLDLGTHWEEKTGVPVPLGCIAVKRSLPWEVQKKIDRLIHDSLRYSRERYPNISSYVKEHAQAMEEGVMRQHIELYVNEYTLTLGADGKKAILLLHDAFRLRKGAAPKSSDDEAGLFI